MFIPVFEPSIPQDCKFVFVSDYFAADVKGGAEFTSEAIIEACPAKIFKLHSQQLTVDLLSKNRNKFWIFGNFTHVKQSVLTIFAKAKAIPYVVIEYDFKFCSYRVPNQHEKETGKPCDCPTTSQGKLIEAFYKNAKALFWMSEKQKDLFLSHVPSLASQKHFIQVSTFSPKTLDHLKALATSVPKSKKDCGVLFGGSWIKGVDQTKGWLTSNGIPYEVIPNLPNHLFLTELAKFSKFAFMPADWDTCPRLVIEAAILGCDLILNENVLHKDEEWFAGKSPEQIDQFMRGRPDFFWQEIQRLFKV